MIWRRATTTLFVTMALSVLIPMARADLTVVATISADTKERAAFFQGLSPEDHSLYRSHLSETGERTFLSHGSLFRLDYGGSEDIYGDEARRTAYFTVPTRKLYVPFAFWDLAYPKLAVPLAEWTSHHTAEGKRLLRYQTYHSQFTREEDGHSTRVDAWWTRDPDLTRMPVNRLCGDQAVVRLWQALQAVPLEMTVTWSVNGRDLRMHYLVTAISLAPVPVSAVTLPKDYQDYGDFDRKQRKLQPPVEEPGARLRLLGEPIRP